MSRLLRMIVVLVLAATLASPALLAAPLRSPQVRGGAVGAPVSLDFVGWLWSWVSSVWGKNGSQADPDGVQIKNGSMIEPDGNTLQSPAPATANADNGHQVDPDGAP